jgi:hypothetical protein
MTPAELAEQCVGQINLVGNGAEVCLVLPGKWGKTDRKRLCPGGPVGQITAEAMGEARPSVVVFFKAMDVLAFLAAKGFIKAVGPDGKDLASPDGTTVEIDSPPGRAL